MSYENYVTYNYNFRDIDKTLKILNKLGVSKHKLLYGVNYVGNTAITDDTVEEIKRLYSKYVSDKTSFGEDKNIRAIPELIGKVISKDLKTNRSFVSEKEQWDFISGLSNEKAFKYKYLVALTLKIFSEKSGYIGRGILNCDKIRFFGEKDISFSTSNGICGISDERTLYIWFEIDPEKDLLLLDNSMLELIITDDTDELSNYLYYVGIVEYNNFNLVIGGKDLSKLMCSDMLDICSEENQFVKYRPELKKFM